MAEELLSHRKYGCCYDRVYWNGNLAGDASDATRAVVEVRTGAYRNDIEFQWPSDRSKIENLEAMLDRAFERGREDAKKEIRSVLGVKDPRS